MSVYDINLWKGGLNMKAPKKKTFLIIAFIAIISISIAYINLSKGKYYDLKKTVWNQLSDQEKATVLKDWEKATVNEITDGETKEFEVRFRAGKASLLGDLIVYVDASTKKIISIKKRA